MSDAELYARPGRSRKELRIGDRVYKSANDWELTDADLETARLELGETEEKRERCLRELKERLLQDKTMNYRTDDRYLLRFLRFRKFDVEKTVQNIKQFYQLRNAQSEGYRLHPDMKYMQDSNFVQYMPYTDEQDRMVVCMNFGNWDPDKYSFEEFSQNISAFTDIITMNPKVQIHGIMGIWNMKGLGMGHFREIMRKNSLPTFIKLAENTYPWRLKIILFPNTGQITRILYGMVRPLIKKKIADRVVLMGSDVTEMHKYINPVLLPKKFGGTLEEEECTVTEHVLDNMPFLKYERTFIID